MAACFRAIDGGLDLAVEAATGAKPAWFVEYDDAPSKILKHHWPDVPNYGDVTKIDWSTMPPVDILTGGYPCQPFSAAGRRKGTNDERHLWPYVYEAIRVLRPRFTLLENVAGHRSLGFDSVLGDLAEGGFHVEWTSIRASDIGAPHHRERLFILVTDPESLRRDSGNTNNDGQADREIHPSANNREATAHTGRCDGGAGSIEGSRRDAPIGCATAGGFEHRGGAGTCSASNPGGEEQSCWPGSSQGEQEWLRRGRSSDSGSEARNGTYDTTPVLRCLPTPSTMDGLPPRSGEARERQLRRGDMNGSARQASGNLREDVIHVDFGVYAPVVRRWELMTDTTAPPPTVPNTRGNPHLNPQFAEWMMGLQTGHVTSPDIGLHRKEQLKAIGNGVCPQQAIAALHELLNR